VNLFKCTIRRIVFRGNDYEVTCGVGDAELRAVAGATGWDTAIREGDRVEVGIPADDVIVFPGSEWKDVVRYEAGS
jgi:hypothetical protein